jgi:hypothetical protein
LLGAFSIIRWCFRHYTGAFAIIRGGSSIIRGAFDIIRGAFTIYIRGAFAIIHSGSSIIRGAFNITRDHRCFHSTLFPYSFHDMHICFNDCLNLVCGWQMLFASGLQWQWLALKRFIYALCNTNLCIYKWI